MPIAMLWPTFALVLLTFTMLITLNVERSLHFWRNPPNSEELARDLDAALGFLPPAGKNLKLLFELPVLYFALVPLLLLTHRSGHIQVLLAWAFVGLRAAQSFAHVVLKNGKASGTAMLGSTLALSAMWIVFFVEMLHSTTS